LSPEYSKFLGTEIIEQLGMRYIASVKAIFTRNSGVWITKMVSLELLRLYPEAKYGAMMWCGKVLAAFLRGPKGKLYKTRAEEEEDEEENGGPEDDEED
jgi:hypothetical protein